MRLWIVRHGKAHPQSSDLDDWARPLVARGQRQAAHLARLIAQRRDRPQRIVSSPVTRAAQTARLIHRELEVPLTWAVELETERPASAAVDLIAAQVGVQRLMIVGHNFQLSDLLGVLVGGNSGNDRPDLSELRTGEAALVEITPERPVGSGTLLGRFRLDDD